MRRLVMGLVLLLLPIDFAGTGVVPLDAQLTTPSDWKWRQDSPAPLSGSARMEPGSWVFVQMPPGWHVTTGPGALLYPAANGDVSGNYSLEVEIFLFPGDSQSEYGVFLGGREVDGSASPEYAAFVLRRDGHAAVLRRGSGQAGTAADWQRHDAVVPHKGGDDAVKNVIRIDLDPLAATMMVNGAKVLSVPRDGLGTDGRIGLRIGKDMNVHVSSFNVTRKLAPVPAKKKL